MSGRHPNGKGELIPIQYATIYCRDTGRWAEYDADMAVAYLRLMACSSIGPMKMF